MELLYLGCPTVLSNTSYHGNANTREHFPLSLFVFPHNPFYSSMLLIPSIKLKYYSKSADSVIVIQNHLYEAGVATKNVTNK